jgi:hypothetical protein
MKDGYLINYEAGLVQQVDEHEHWIRRDANADFVKISSIVQTKFNEFVPTTDRNKFMLFVMSNSPLMRVRGHGSNCTFEFNSKIRKCHLKLFIFSVQIKQGHVLI